MIIHKYFPSLDSATLAWEGSLSHPTAILSLLSLLTCFNLHPPSAREKTLKPSPATNIYKNFYDLGGWGGGGVGVG